MKRLVLFALLFVMNCFAVHVAVLETIRTEETLDYAECQFLTDKLRQMAVMSLPSYEGYTIMTRENINAMLPPGKSVEDCEGSCLIETGKNISADYVAQGRVSRFGSLLTITVELYETASGKLVSSFAVQSRTAEGLLLEIENRSKQLFMPIKQSADYKSRNLKSENRMAKPVPVQDDSYMENWQNSKKKYAREEKKSVYAMSSKEARTQNENVFPQPQAKMSKSYHSLNFVVPIENQTWGVGSTDFDWNSVGYEFSWTRYKVSQSGFSSVFGLYIGYIDGELEDADLSGSDFGVKFGWGGAPVRGGSVMFAIHFLMSFDFKMLDGTYNSHDTYNSSDSYSYYYDSYSHDFDYTYDYNANYINFSMGGDVILAFQFTEYFGLLTGLDIMTNAFGLGSLDAGNYDDTFSYLFSGVNFIPHVGLAFIF